MFLIPFIIFTCEYMSDRSKQFRTIKLNERNLEKEKIKYSYIFYVNLE